MIAIEKIVNGAKISSEDKQLLYGVKLSAQQERALCNLLSSVRSRAWCAGYDEGVIDTTERLKA